MSHTSPDNQGSGRHRFLGQRARQRLKTAAGLGCILSGAFGACSTTFVAANLIGQPVGAVVLLGGTILSGATMVAGISLVPGRPGPAYSTRPRSP